MAFRTVYGNDWSENGWRMVDQGSCQWVTVPGTGVTLQIQIGIPVALLRAFAADFNAYVEPLRDADSACWTEGNSVDTSNHLSGTAEDLDWDSHPFRILNAGFNAAQIATIRELLAFYTYRGIQLVWWGNDWQSPRDAMHFQVGYDTYDNQPICNEFIARFIRADGYSTFRRGTAPLAGDAAMALSAATGLTLNRATEILPTMQAGLRLAECTNPNRIAMALAQWGHEADNFNATEEYADGPLDQERWIYKGRTWIQLTWKSNYAGFSQWCFDRGLVPSPSYFVDNPTVLADLKWAGLGAAYYWTAARPTINSLCDVGDLVGVTRLINGGTNGLEDSNGSPGRRSRYTRALASGDKLLDILNTTGDEDEMAGWTPELVNRALVLLENQAGVERPSLSPLRWPGEGDVNTCAGFAWTADGNVHVVLVEKLAVTYGDPQAVALLIAVEATSRDQVKYEDRQEDAKLARLILAKVSAEAKAEGQAWLAEHGVNV